MLLKAFHLWLWKRMRTKLLIPVCDSYRLFADGEERAPLTSITSSSPCLWLPPPEWRNYSTKRSLPQGQFPVTHKSSKICSVIANYFCLLCVNCSWREVDVFAKPIAEEDDAVEVRPCCWSPSSYFRLSSCIWGTIGLLN